jgi:hypothetical protein
MKLAIRLTVYGLFLSGVFFAAYRLTEAWFRLKLIPYPFEFYGIAAGVAMMAWAFSLLQFLELLWAKLFNTEKKDKAYAVKAERRVSEVELFK